MQLSVIILNYNVRYFLEQCVLSVQKALEGIDGEIIVVDNNSSDASCAMMQQKFPAIKLITNKENLGFPKGNNIGVAAAKGEFLCILNPDTIVAEDTFSKILNSKNWSANTGIIGCKLIDGTGNFLPESKRGVPTPWVSFTKIFGLYKFSNSLGKYYAQHLNENESGKVDILVGAFMVIKRELYNKIGGFDENCFMYSDDIDLSYRVLQEGKYNYYFHETTVIHYKGESTIRDGKYMKRFQEAMNFFYKKHFKVSIFFKIFMKIGIVLFSIVKRFQGKIKEKVQPENYVLVTENNNKSELTHQLQKKLNIKFIETILDRNRIEFIIDLNSISFKKAIHWMENNKKKNHTFKLLPPNSNFILGSNSSNDRGEVKAFKE
ncbi:glycosyltransferase family 2 protein [Flavobacterium sp.]|uniref:glycosyltransferase family 2 protein n=1 Tax=Flavobacterium sp. TaxID=239 RepID=UPI003BE076C8